MPKETFLKLSKDKKEKIIKAAKKEFSRTSIENASIQNIIEDAGIPRGSFYQYFEDKKDLLYYIIEEHTNKINNLMEESIRSTNGDIIEMFINMYEYLTEKDIDREDKEILRNVFENLKAIDDSIFLKRIQEIRPKDIMEYYDLIDKDKFKIKDKEDFELISKLLFSITQKAIATSFKYDSKEQAKKIYLKQLEFLKYGIIK